MYLYISYENSQSIFYKELGNAALLGCLLFDNYLLAISLSSVSYALLYHRVTISCTHARMRFDNWVLIDVSGKNSCSIVEGRRACAALMQLTPGAMSLEEEDVGSGVRGRLSHHSCRL